MGAYLPWTGAAPINCCLKKRGIAKHTWELRWKPVCGSTEIELSRWLKRNPLFSHNSRALISAKQSFGKGQRGRVWESPNGGVWMSVAMNFDKANFSVGLFGLAVAVALANRFEKDSIPVKIKWPNDLLVEGRKLVGFLPRIIYRGNKPKLICLGVGLNVSNRVPKQGISLYGITGQTNISTSYWTHEVLIAIEKAICLLGSPISICKEAERLLWAKTVNKYNSNQIWDIEGLDFDGRLIVSKGLIKETWNRWE